MSLSELLLSATASCNYQDINFRFRLWIFYNALGLTLRDSVGTGATKSQIVRTPLQVFYDCVGKPDWIVFSRFESIYGRAILE